MNTYSLVCKSIHVKFILDELLPAGIFVHLVCYLYRVRCSTFIYSTPILQSSQNLRD